MSKPATITVHDAEALDGMPDETLIRASGRYMSDGTFTDCWARPVPQHITGTEERAWQVLVFGSCDHVRSIVPASAFAYPVTVLYTDPTRGRGVVDTGIATLPGGAR